jgi:glutathione S-transferase
MKLMYAPQSPFARKVRAAAIELMLADRIELEYAEVVPSRRNTAYAESINPLRKVPALVLDDGKTVLFDSTVICEFLEAHHLLTASYSRWSASGRALRSLRPLRTPRSLRCSTPLSDDLGDNIAQIGGGGG